jgi:hypothetical protein
MQCKPVELRRVAPEVNVRSFLGKAIQRRRQLCLVKLEGYLRKLRSQISHLYRISRTKALLDLYFPN